MVVFEQRDQIMLDGSKWGRQKDDGHMSASDEEILPLEGLAESESDDDDDDDDEEISDGQDDDRSLMDEQEQEEEELDNEAWGSSRKAYYGADDVSDDEDVAQEEQEAERLQKKHLARLRPEDFLDTWTDKPETAPSTNRIVIEELPPPDLSKLSKVDVLKLLKTRHPEVPRLAGVYQHLHPQLSSLSLLAQRPFHPQHATINLKFALLSVLLSSIAVYFAVRADARERNSTQKRLLAKISETEALWEQISSIHIDENALDIKELVSTETQLNNQIILPPKPKPSLNGPTRKRKRPVKTLADDLDASDDDLSTTLALLKKTRTKSKPTIEVDDDLSDFADATTLHPLDAQEKHQNKKTLRFYTSQIEGKSSKRREKYSGDTEVFKERRNDRNERQIQEAKKRGQPLAIDTLDDEDPVLKSPTSADADNDYYNFIAKKASHKKSTGKEEYESAKASAKAYLLGELDDVDESGKRLITRQIEKNKGLMPHRSKDVRNPRVKKRKKYEKKKIALKGRQQVYQVGDKRRGAYGGEQTGISKNVVRGVKLG
jgi:U3 small nucleolar RNA-associated protein 3